MYIKLYTKVPKFISLLFCNPVKILILRKIYTPHCKIVPAKRNTNIFPLVPFSHPVISSGVRLSLPHNSSMGMPWVIMQVQAKDPTMQVQAMDPIMQVQAMYPDHAFFF